MIGVIAAFAATFLGWLFWLEGRLEQTFSDRILKAWIFTHAQIFFTVLALGGVGILSLYSVLPVHFGVFAFIFVTRKCDGAEVWDRWLNAIRCAFRNIPDTLKSSPGTAVFLAFVLAELAWLGIYSALMPIHGWDALAYHLAISAGFAKTGALTPLQVSYENVINYVGSPHLFYGWAALFPVSSGFLSVLHYSYLLMAMVSVYACVRSLGVKWHTAALVAGAAGMSPIFILESVRLYVDVAVAALFMSCAAQFYLWMRTRNRLSLIAAALALGLMHGAKLQCVVFTVILLVWVVLFMRPPRKDLFKPATVSLLLISILIGSFWFFYRYHRFNNPLYPVEVRLLGHKFFPGRITPNDDSLDFRVKPPLLKAIHDEPQWQPLLKTAKIVISWLELSRMQHAYIHTVSGGFGPLMAVLLIPAALGALTLRLPGRSFLFLTVLLGYTPLGHVSRYTPMIPLVLAVPAAVFLGSGGMKRWIVPVAGLAIYVSASILNPFLAGGLGEIILNGPVRELARGEIGAGSVFFFTFILLAAISLLLKKWDGWVFLFVPVLLTAIGLTYHFPGKKQVAILTADREEKLAFCFQRRPLHHKEIEWEQMMLGHRAANLTTAGDTLYYTGEPFPCTMGMMWNERMSNLPVHLQKPPLPGKIIGCRDDYCVSIETGD